MNMNNQYEKHNDKFYMRRAIDLAKKGCGWVNPNPMVGAVIVKNGHIIGEGYHEKYGQLHAERNAIKNCMDGECMAHSEGEAKEVLQGATIYVTLEPCCHHGKQPPCTEAIIESGIQRVVVGSGDPNPLVAGKGIEILRSHGIEVVTDFMKEECDEINPVFFHYMTTGFPLVIMKYAMTMDGKIASYTGKSQWITSEEARKHVHEQRNKYAAIMTGIGTVLADNPMLTCRIEGGKNPIRIICDTNLQIPLDSNLVKTAKDVPTVIATAVEGQAFGDMQSNQEPQDEHQENVMRKKVLDLKASGCELITPGTVDGHIDLKRLVHMLGTNETNLSCGKIDSIYLEGGQTLNWSALQSGIVNRVNAYIAPKIFGGVTAFSPVGGQGVEAPNQAFHLKNTKMIQLGCDFLMEGDVCLQEL